ncbi:MAG: putative metalloprotease with PDZ domain, partial [Woeseiaceae bacterium]
ASNLHARLRDYHAGDTVTITVFRDESLVRHRVRLGDAPEDTCYLEVETDPGEVSRKLQDAWLEAAS